MRNTHTHEKSVEAEAEEAEYMEKGRKKKTGKRKMINKHKKWTKGLLACHELLDTIWDIQ